MKTILDDKFKDSDYKSGNDEIQITRVSYTKGVVKMK